MNAYKSRIVVAVLATAAGISVAFVPTANGGQAGFVPAHRHFIQAPDGTQIPVGPQACGNPTVQTAFNQFHARIHVGTVGTVAMDHAHNPVDIKFALC